MFLRRPLLWMIVIVAVGLVARAYSLNFGLPALYDPDEPIFVLAGLKLLKNHTLNPGWFGHPGSTTIYMMALIELGVVTVGVMTGRFANAQAFGTALYHDPSVVFLPGRWFILTCGIICIILIYIIARKLFDVRTALLTAALLALDPLDIRYSQVIRTDKHASVFMLIAIIVCIEIVRRGRLRDYALAGIFIGLACTTKWPAATALASLLGAISLRIYRDPATLRRELKLLMLTMGCTFAAMFVSAPFLFLDYQTVLRDLGGEAQVRHLSTTGGGFLWNMGWYVTVPLNNAFGAIGVVMLLPGALLAARASREALATTIPISLIFLLALCTQGLVQMRWVVPVLPLLTMFVAVAAWKLVDFVTRLTSKQIATGATFAILALLAVPPAMVARAETIERLHDTRRAATDWARAHIPRGSSLTIEYFAFDIVDQPWTIKFPSGDPGCVNVANFIGAQTPYSKISKWRDKRALVDLGTVNPAKLDACRSDYLLIVDYDRYLAERPFYGAEIAQYQNLTADSRQVAIFAPVAGQMGGPIVRIFQRQTANNGLPPAQAEPNNASRGSR
jgi:4-amino-4-deoxy-L-arabinose transferase-like glycosyltransferase